MPPAHRNFNRAQSMTPRHVQQLRVEPETFDRLLLEDDAAALAPERFETALRIDERQPQDGSHYLVEDDSGEFAEGRLVHADQAAVHRPRANRHVIDVQSVNEFAGFLNRRREIRVRKKGEAAARFLHPVAYAVAFASIDAIRNHAQRGNLDAKIFRHRGCAILGAVVHDQNFGLRPEVERYAAIRSSVAGRRTSSLYEGIMIERSKSGELIVRKVPASHGSRRAAQIGSLPASLWGKHHRAFR